MHSEPGQRSDQQYNEKCRQGTDSVVHECRCMAIYPDLHVSVKSTGYNMVIYLSSISGIDTTLYEAAVMDGANKRQQVWHITLPCLKSVIIMMFILNVGRSSPTSDCSSSFLRSKRFDLQNDSNYRHICIQRTAVFHSDRNDFCGNILPVCCMLHHHPSCQCHCEED